MAGHLPTRCSACAPGLPGCLLTPVRACARALWPLYWLAQGTMFWALFVVGHDWCAAQSARHQRSLVLL